MKGPTVIAEGTRVPDSLAVAGRDDASRAPAEETGSGRGDTAATMRAWIAGLALIAITVVAYLPVGRAGFIWDDDIMLTRNPFVQAADGLRAIWFSTELPDYFPLTSTALWLQWRLWGPDPLGYHVVNVVLHAFAAVLWWRVFLRLRVPAAWLAAAIFALHPVNVESVAWITELKNTLAMVFFAGAVLAYVRFDDAGRGALCPDREAQTQPSRGVKPLPQLSGGVWYAAALGLFLGALLSKTAVAPLPLVLLGFAWWRRGRLAWSDVGRSVPFFALSGVLAAVTMWFHHHRAIAGTIVRDDDLVTRLAGAGWGIWFYLGKALVPVNLMFVYPRWEIDATSVLAFVPLVFVMALFGVAWRGRSEWGRSPLFVLGSFVALLLPVLGFVDISYMRHSLVADRWQYFAIVAPIAFVAAGLGAAWRRFGPRGRIAGTAASAVLLFGLGAQTWRQSRIYIDVDALWQATLARNPASAVAHNEVGTSLLQAGRVDEAIAHYERSLAAIPDYALAHHNYGCALLKRGDFAAAIERFRRALSHQPKFAPAQHYLGQALLQAGDIDAAMTELRVALSLQPDFAETHYQLGTAWLQKANPAEAATSFRRAIALAPGSVQAHNDLGVALIHSGHAEQALAHFEAALALDSNSAEAHNNVGKILASSGRGREGVGHFKAALELQPDDADTLANLAWTLATTTDAAVRSGAQAIFFAQRANQRERRDDPLVLRALAAAFAESGRFAEAIATAERGIGFARQRELDAFAAMLAADLDHYRRGAPLREPAAVPDGRMVP